MKVGGSVGSSVSSFSTTFPATENPISEGGAWKNGLADGLDWSNVATGLLSDSSTHGAYGTQVPHGSPPYDDSLACLTGFPANHWCQGTIYNDGAITGLPEVELLLRCNPTGHSWPQYEIDIISDVRIVIVQWLGPLNSFSIESGNITTNVSVANGAVWYAEIVGNIITVKCNTVTVYTGNITTFANAPIASGNPGIGFFADTLNSSPNQNTQANRHFNWKSFSAGSL
jgi:hypothetical protein